MKTKEMVKPGYFYARFDEEWWVMAKLIGQKVHVEAKGNKLGET